jgi:hypothetical protein
MSFFSLSKSNNLSIKYNSYYFIMKTDILELSHIRELKPFTNPILLQTVNPKLNTSHVYFLS